MVAGKQASIVVQNVISIPTVPHLIIQTLVQTIIRFDLKNETVIYEKFVK